MKTERAKKRKGVVLTEQEQGLFSYNNKAFIRGQIGAELEFCHQIRDERYFETVVAVKRNSKIEDIIPVIISERLIGTWQIKQSNEGKWGDVAGEFLSYKRIGEDGKNHLKLFLYVKGIKIYEEENFMPPVPTNNLIYLSGYVCKKPVYRKTSFEKDITDLIIGVSNKELKLYSCIPCISFYGEALKTAKYEEGDKVELYGRMQSRDYFKQSRENSREGEIRTAYEISTIIVKNRGKVF